MDESRCRVSGLEAGVTRVTLKDACQAVKTSNIVSAIIILNLVALATLGLILAAFHFAGSAAMIVVPFWVVFLLCGYPWSDLGAGSNGSWSGLDVYFEVMLLRGVFINATIVGLCIAWWKRAHSPGGPTHSATRFGQAGKGWQAGVVWFILASDAALLILPMTSYTHRAELEYAWAELSKYTYYYPRRPSDPPFAKSGFRREVQDVLGDPRGNREGRRRLTALALALEVAINVAEGDGSAVERAERQLSAALLCVRTGSWSHYPGRVPPTFELVGAELDTPERAAALHEFIERLKDKHTLPPGNGCPQ